MIPRTSKEILRGDRRPVFVRVIEAFEALDAFRRDRPDDMAYVAEAYDLLKGVVDELKQSGNAVMRKKTGSTQAESARILTHDEPISTDDIPF